MGVLPRAPESQGGKPSKYIFEHSPDRYSLLGRHSNAANVIGNRITQNFCAHDIRRHTIDKIAASDEDSYRRIVYLSTLWTFPKEKENAAHALGTPEELSATISSVGLAARASGGIVPGAVMEFASELVRFKPRFCS